MRFPWKRPDPAQNAARGELKQRLTPEQFRVTQQGGTERPFSGRYHDAKDHGTYRCVVCEAPLFDSDAKYDSGTGWPSFSQAVEGESVRRRTDRKLGIKRVEARCAACDAHLGHVFPDGPTHTGERFCMNSASLHLDTSTEPS